MFALKYLLVTVFFLNKFSWFDTQRILRMHLWLVCAKTKSIASSVGHFALFVYTTQIRQAHANEKKTISDVSVTLYETRGCYCFTSVFPILCSFV